jgi:hypothetical protein
MIGLETKNLLEGGAVKACNALCLRLAASERRADTDDMLIYLHVKRMVQDMREVKPAFVAVALPAPHSISPAQLSSPSPRTYITVSQS